MSPTCWPCNRDSSEAARSPSRRCQPIYHTGIVVGDEQTAIGGHQQSHRTAPEGCAAAAGLQPAAHQITRLSGLCALYGDIDHFVTRELRPVRGAVIGHDDAAAIGG